MYFLVLVGITAAFRFANLGYSDYWGDEMNGLLRAIPVIAGRQEMLFDHTKGLVEVLSPAVSGLLGGRFEPRTLRFPLHWPIRWLWAGIVSLPGACLVEMWACLPP